MELKKYIKKNLLFFFIFSDGILLLFDFNWYGCRYVFEEYDIVWFCNIN